MRYDRLFINGRWEEPDTQGRLTVINPATGEEVGSAPDAGERSTNQAVAAARKAFATWSASDLEMRAATLERFADLMDQHRVELADLIEAEMGAPAPQSIGEQVDGPIEVTRYYAELLRGPQVAGQEWLEHSLIVREPIGVVGAITPWNYPVHQLVAKIVPAIAAGCTVVAKPAELTPLSSFRIAELLDEAGVPAGVFNLVSGQGSIVGETLAAHPDIDMLSFTGSTRAGKRVMALGAETVKRVVVELGGKSASILIDGADTQAAVEATVDYCMTNAGQCCNAWTRLIVPQEILAEVEQVAVGRAQEIEAEQGPLVSQAQYDRVQNYIELGLEEGARLLTGGVGRRPGKTRGHFARVTVFSDVTPEMRIAQEEIFGPVLVIMPYKTVDEAVKIANDSPYGLHGGVWAATTAEAASIAARLRVGQVDINGADFNINAPFGGYKQSGNGREFGVSGLREFQEIKAIQFPSNELGNVGEGI